MTLLLPMTSPLINPKQPPVVCCNKKNFLLSVITALALIAISTLGAGILIPFMFGNSTISLPGLAAGAGVGLVMSLFLFYILRRVEDREGSLIIRSYLYQPQ